MLCVAVSTAGLLLIVFGVVLLILELKVPSFGVLGIGGTVALVIGSIMVGVLPQLPPELEYRSTEGVLVLVDGHANLVVDMLAGPLSFSTR